MKMIQQTTTTSTPTYPSDPRSFTLHVKNYQFLPSDLQRLTRAALSEFFHAWPQIQKDGSIKMYAYFLLPVHSGQYQRRIEMLIFRLRSHVNAGLEFEASFGY